MKKKVFLSFLLVFGLFFVMGRVGADGITACNSVFKDGVIVDQKIPDTVSLIIKVIRIAVPVLLVIFGSLDLLKGVIAGKDDEIKKGQQMFIKRLIAGALVFFVFIIVQFVISLVADSDENAKVMKCAKCFINGGEESCNPRN